MIDLENFNKQKFEDIVDTAKKQISYLSNDWTNVQLSDPGITLIDLFAWLKVLQHEKMNKISISSKYRFLDLLNIKKIQNKGSNTLLKISNISKDQIIPKGTKWFANDLIFENNEEEFVISSNIVSVDFENDQFNANVIYNEFDRKRIFYLFGEEFKSYGKTPYFKINFDSPLQNGSKFNLYFEVFLDNKYIRNPIKEQDDFVEMAKVEWELYGLKDGIVGWHKLDVICDDTHNFLFSGTISFNLNVCMEKFEDKFSIRAKLVSQKYDFPPRIINILTNVFSVTQRSTLCENIILKRKNILTNRMAKVKSHLSLYGKHVLYVKEKDGWKSISDYTVARDIHAGETKFEISENVFKSVLKLKNDEPALMIVSYDESIKDKMIIGSGTGISDQEYGINIDNILYDGFEIMVGNKNNDEIIFEKWNKVNDLYTSDKYGKDYILDCDDSKIIFGDNEYGIAPRKLNDNIVLIGFSITLGKGSNIKSGIINKVKSENPEIKKFIINQIVSANGGMDAESFEDMESRAAKVLENNKRAITIEDYEHIARMTPGLIRSNIKVLPSYVGEKRKSNNRNYVTIVVRGSGQRNMCLKGYKENIKNYVDKYRLINTEVKVVEPIYIGLDIGGQIVVNSYYRESANDIINSIKIFVEKVNDDCGSTFYYGDLFGMLDRLNSVSYIDKLYVEPVGDYLEKTLSDDIIIPPNGMYYIRNLNLNYINDSNIY